ncbi:MAG: ApaG domain [Polyangiaceae bacterium]|nr:ApaG domain [Polyangiaceae bacterium]
MLRYLPESNALTQGIRVSVKSSYLPEQSSPAERRYVFAYTVRIINEGEAVARLRSRHWVITDANGGVEEVRRGTYLMERTDGSSFDAEIATFALTLPATLN